MIIPYLKTYKFSLTHKYLKHLCLNKKVFILNSTTSVLITTTLIYTIGAGITAAAGTRLALQLIS